MGRKRKKKVDYFPHEVNHGKTMTILEKKYGNDGYAFWFKLLEKLGDSEGHYLDLSKDEDRIYLSSEANLSEEKCIEILDLLSRLDAIDSDLWESKRIVWSDNFLENIRDVYSKRETDLPRKPEKSPRKKDSRDENEQSKGKESKEKQSKEENTNSESEDSDVLTNKYSGGEIEKEACDLTEWFCNEINDITEKVDTPGEGSERFKKWMVAFCRIEEHDGFSWDEIKKTLKWGLKDSFWNDKIRSATGLRKRSDRNEQRKIVNIYESMKSDKEANSGERDGRSRESASSDSRKQALESKEQQDSDVPF